MFGFTIGHDNPSCRDDENAIDSWDNLFLYDNHLIFRSESWTDAIYVKGIRYGRIGGVLGISTFVTQDQCIVEVGLLKYNGRSVITHMKLSPDSASSDSNPIDVNVRGGQDCDKGYIYKSQKIGLQIELIAVGTNSSGVQAITWMLHKKKGLEFNQEEFQNFWNWLVDEKYELQTIKASCQCCYCKQKEKIDAPETKENKTLEEIRGDYEEEFKYVCSIFEGKDMHTEPTSEQDKKSEHKEKNQVVVPAVPSLVQQISIVSPTSCHFDMGNVLIVNLPHLSMYMGSNGVTSLILFGKVIDTSGDREFLTSGLPSDIYEIANHILGDLLARACARKLLIEECVNIHGHKTKYINDKQGRAIVCLFTRIGANLILTTEEIPDWNIYNLCALAPTIGGTADAFICGVIQLFAPIFLSVFSILQHAGGMEYNPVGSDWNPRFLASFLILYLFAWNHKLLMSSNSERKLNFFLILLCDSSNKILSRNWVLMGLVVHTFAYLFICIASVAILISTEDPIDIVLNALALLFIKDLDYDLVDDEYVDRVQTKAKMELSKLFSMKLKKVFTDNEIEDHKSIAALAHKFKRRFGNFTAFSKFLLLVNMTMLAILSIAVLIYKMKPEESDS